MNPFQTNPQGDMSKDVGAMNFEGRNLFTDDLAASAQRVGTVVQRGAYALTGGKQFVSFPRYYTSANSVNNLVVMLQSKTTNPSFVDSVATAPISALSAVSGFTVSGSGTDTGFWFSLGYR